MSRISQFYRKNVNGIIITLIFHIILFILLYMLKIGKDKEIKETEFLIDLSEVMESTPNIQNQKENEPIKDNITQQSDISSEQLKRSANNLRTNAASNRTSSAQNKSFNEQFDRDLEEAQNLIKEVSQQLKREIPTIENLKMPDAPKATSDDIKNKSYTGESNIEYFLDNRFHIKLPVPVYLAEGGGIVKVEILVDRLGNVIKAEPVIDSTLSEQILSYAKTAAFKTKFNQDNDAPAAQKGHIIYTFIPQN